MSSLAAELKTQLLRRPRLTLAAAESLTAGHVQARIAAVSGSSAYFRGGVTAYALEEKARLLGVDRAAAKKVNCVSAAVAEQMAVGALKLFRTDLAVAGGRGCGTVSSNASAPGAPTCRRSSPRPC